MARGARFLARACLSHLFAKLPLQSTPDSCRVVSGVLPECPSSARDTKTEQLTPKSAEEMHVTSLGSPDERPGVRPSRLCLAGWKPALKPVLLTLFGLVVVPEASSIAQGAETYAEAYRLASQTGRPMVVLVGAEWCGPCQTMKQNVIPQVRRRGLLGRVAFATVCVDRQRELGRQLTRGGPIPQLLMFRRTNQGWRLSRLTGGQSVGKVEAFIDDGLKRDAAEKKEVVRTEQAPQASSDSAEGKSG